MKEDHPEYSRPSCQVPQRATNDLVECHQTFGGVPPKSPRPATGNIFSVGGGSRLLWRLLRQHVSLPQLAAFFLANLLGMFIVMFGCQCYRDVSPLFSSDDGILQVQYVIIHKPVSSMSALGMGRTATFSEEEIRQIEAQPFCHRDRKSVV